MTGSGSDHQNRIRNTDGECNKILNINAGQKKSKLNIKNGRTYKKHSIKRHITPTPTDPTESNTVGTQYESPNRRADSKITRILATFLFLPSLLITN